MSQYIVVRELRSSIKAYLESLVHNRFTREELEKTLSEYFEYNVSVNDITKKGEGYDYNLFLPMDFEYPIEHIYGNVNFYFLPTRKEGVIYITEVVVEFKHFNK